MAQRRGRFPRAAWVTVPSLLLSSAGIVSSGCSGCARPAIVPPVAAIPVRPQPVTLPPTPPESVTFSPPVGLSPAPAPVLPPVARSWRPAVDERDWKYIVIHHTASERGDVESIHNAHLKNKDKSGKAWLGIGYHFVIGNGQGMGDGEIEPTFRWKQQMQGAHAGNTEHNQHGIGICLVGNFEETPPTAAQLAAVKELVGGLKQSYAIATDRVIGHGDVKATACPGRLFPLDELKNSVAVNRQDGRPPNLLTLAAGPTPAAEAAPRRQKGLDRP